jgi:hypothetical protein
MPFPPQEGGGGGGGGSHCRRLKAKGRQLRRDTRSLLLVVGRAGRVQVTEGGVVAAQRGRGS